MVEGEGVDEIGDGSQRDDRVREVRDYPVPVIPLAGLKPWRWIAGRRLFGLWRARFAGLGLVVDVVKLALGVTQIGR